MGYGFGLRIRRVQGCQHGRGLSKTNDGSPDIVIAFRHPKGQVLTCAKTAAGKNEGAPIKFVSRLQGDNGLSPIN